MKCEELGAINMELMTKYQIIEELQNSSKELNNELAITIVGKLLNDSSKE